MVRNDKKIYVTGCPVGASRHRSVNQGQHNPVGERLQGTADRIDHGDGLEHQAAKFLKYRRIGYCQGTLTNGAASLAH